MSYAKMKGMQLALADLGKQLKQLNERLDSQDSFLKVKGFSFYSV